jgi:hypothetical protein
MAQTYNSSIQQAKAGGSQFQLQPGVIARPSLKNKKLLRNLENFCQGELHLYIQTGINNYTYIFIVIKMSNCF